MPRSTSPKDIDAYLAVLRARSASLSAIAPSPNTPDPLEGNETDRIKFNNAVGQLALAHVMEATGFKKNGTDSLKREARSALANVFGKHEKGHLLDDVTTAVAKAVAESIAEQKDLSKSVAR